eukprot:15073317-Ditylum_brightwellii.AAC.1
MWETLLYSTGGELSLNNKYWWLLYWIWEGGKARLATKQECPESMKITICRDTTKSKVKRKDPHKMVKQLGVLVYHSGNFREELERNIWLPACQYPLVVTTFSKKDWLSIMKLFVHAILPKLWFNRNLPREIVYGSMKYSGFHLLHLYLEQGYLVLKILIGHIQEETIVGLQLMIALSFIQV